MSTIANAFYKLLDFFDQNKWAGLILGLVVGIILGVVFARVFVKVELANTTPGSLRSDFREDYLLWIARNYENQSLANPDWARIQLLGYDHNKERRKDTIERDVGDMSTALDELAALCDTPEKTDCSGDDATRLRNLSADIKTITPDSLMPDDEQPASPSLLSRILPICLGAFVLVAVLGGAFIAYRWWRGRQEEQEVREAIAERTRTVAPVAAWGAAGEPLAQFPTTYALGDDHFDPSFSIELENGEFMGECGVGISETIGVGTPNKVTAFEVWLFDKSDIRTVTKVVMSDYAYGDEALRTKLAPKGEPVLANEGAEVVLETKTLRVKARIVEAQHGVGNLPENSFFERLSIDLAAWKKSPPEVGAELPPEESDFTLSDL